MNKALLATTFLITALACSCSPKPTAEKPHGVLTDAQKQTLEKAKNTEELLDKEAKDRMKAADDATQ